MTPPNIADAKFSKSRNRKKIARTLLQVIILAVVIGMAVYSYLNQKTYQPYEGNAPLDNGFIALSYFGVQKTDGSQYLISQDNLREQLTTLKELGYETITPEDIYAYYTNHKPLPEKALYLMFEDGRRDTAIFSTPILEDLNYHATTFTYPEKFDKGDTKFLLPDDLRQIDEHGFWDVGTNGYRLFFINVYDRYDNYLGELDPLMFNMVAPYLGRKYNHYLMDYIRDKNGVPKESYQRMRDRISYDYEKLEKVYNSELGYVPKVSVLMHANTGEFGNNAQVSAVNAYWLQKMFAMNFNREGYSLNVPNSSIYDLTRMQPQAWWPVNHLLMRIKYDTHKDLTFKTGEADKFASWDLQKGAVEFKNETAYLTSIPKENGIVKLKGTSRANVEITTELLGNKAGTQSIFLRADDNLQNFIAVEASGNNLYIKERINGKDTELAKMDIDELEKKQPISVDEDKHEAETTALEAFSRYAPSEGIAKVYINRLKEKTKEEPKTIADGAPVYTPVIRNNAKGDYKLDIKLDGKSLTLAFDGDEVANVDVYNQSDGQIYLRAGWTGVGWQQRNLDDDVYDAVYKNLTIKDLNTDNILFTTNYSGLEKVTYTTKKYFETIVDWFVRYL